MDLGGGTGRVSAALGPFAGRARFVIVDIEPALLARARRNGFATVRADARALPFRDNTIAAIIAVDAFHHFPEPASVLAEVWRTVAAGGVLAFVEFDPGSFGGRAVRAVEWALRFGSHFHAPEDLAARVRRAGARATRVVRFSARDYALVAEKGREL
ncbi:MAG: class I SAM-dependent methyltransferase [Thermoplasmatota archaeon]